MINVELATYFLYGWFIFTGLDAILSAYYAGKGGRKVTHDSSYYIYSIVVDIIAVLIIYYLIFL